MLKFVPAGLCLDVGAATGRASLAWSTRNPNLEVVSFEPFLGNLEHFERLCGDKSNITLTEKAVTDFVGCARLYVSATLKGTERNWEGFKGYSSSGRLIPEGHPKWDHAGSQTVEATTLDSEVREHVLLLKIDVQGSEHDVLSGARELFDRYGVDMVYVEFSGEADVLEFLTSRSYVLFDNNYIYSPDENNPAPDTLGDFHTASLSSGRQVYMGVVKERRLSDAGFRAQWDMTGEHRHRLQTDLLAVSPKYLPIFLRACAALLS